MCVDLADALRARTPSTRPARTSPSWKGSIEPGKVADLCVLDRPLLDLDPHAITDAEVEMTVFDGRVVHER